MKRKDPRGAAGVDMCKNSTLNFLFRPLPWHGVVSSIPDVKVWRIFGTHENRWDG